MPRAASASARRQDVRAAAVAAHAEREDVRMFDEQQQIADAAGRRSSTSARCSASASRVRHEAEAADFEPDHGAAGRTIAHASGVADPSSRACA